MTIDDLTSEGYFITPETEQYSNSFGGSVVGVLKKTPHYKAYSWIKKRVKKNRKKRELRQQKKDAQEQAEESAQAKSEAKENAQNTTSQNTIKTTQIIDRTNQTGVATTSIAPKESMSLGVKIGIGVGVALVIGVGIYLATKKKK